MSLLINIVLLRIFYFLLKNPDCYDQTVEEILHKFPNKRDSIITLEEIRSRGVPYIDAVIKESMRLLPSAATVLDRIVPIGGRSINGYHIPEGVI